MISKLGRENNMQKRYIIINSTKYFEKYVVYDLILEDVIECHNLATAKSVAKELNEKNTFCLACICDPCDCHK
jgi:hypothetical protein